MLTCVDCRQDFSRYSRKGRVPLYCPACRGKAQQRAVAYSHRRAHLRRMERRVNYLRLLVLMPDMVRVLRGLEAWAERRARRAA